jgi:hypothetical protein
MEEEVREGCGIKYEEKLVRLCIRVWSVWRECIEWKVK